MTRKMQRGNATKQPKCQMPPYPESNPIYAYKNSHLFLISFIYIYMHGNGKIASVKSAKLTIHLQRTCKRRIIPTVCRSLQKSFSNSDDEATDPNQEIKTTRLERNFKSSSHWAMLHAGRTNPEKFTNPEKKSLKRKTT